jgi:hypothetical protein
LGRWNSRRAKGARRAATGSGVMSPGSFLAPRQSRGALPAKALRIWPPRIGISLPIKVGKNF